MEYPISASHGAMRSLPAKLELLLSKPEHVLRKEEKRKMQLLKEDLLRLNEKLLRLEPSEVVHPASTANCWVKEVRELSYDVDDFVDELDHVDADGKISVVQETLFANISRLLENLNRRRWIIDEISGFSARLEEAIDRYKSWNLDKRTMRSTPPTLDSGLHEVKLVDIDGGQLKELIESRLLSTDEHKLKVVSITGFGGVGKTTLSKQLYSHLRGRFDCRAFVRTSRKPDMRRLLTDMLSQLRPHQPVDARRVGHLIHNIRTHLQDKKYFIVIDDLWTHSTWDTVIRALPDSNSCCSRILITTEVDIVAHTCCGDNSDNIVRMEPLSDTGSGKLFSSIVGNHREYPGLDEIIRKCGGLPLASVTTASLLPSQKDGSPRQEDITGQLDYVNKSLGYGLRTNTSEGMKQVLSLSYNNLPHHLKACMLYLSMYPEDHILCKHDLVKQWIAEGFIRGVGGRDVEELATSYFDELVNRRLIQPADVKFNGEVLSCTVHYVVLDLVRYKSMQENFITAVDHSQTAIRLADKVRRLSLHFGGAEDATPPTNMRLSQVRSLSFFGLFNCMPSIAEFRLVRVLILELWVSDSDVTINLTEISELFRLKYLKISASHLCVQLPTKMQRLKYLVALKVEAQVTTVPSDIIDLGGLLHLSLPSETGLPNAIGRMTALQTLGYVNLSSTSEDCVLNLGELTNLRDIRLTVSTQPSDQLEDNLKCLSLILKKLCNLKSLILSPASSSHTLDALSLVDSPPTLLQRLEFSPRACIFSSIPRWIPALRNLSILKIAANELSWNDMVDLEKLPALGTLSLYVRTAPSTRIVITTIGFRVLKYFKFMCTEPCVGFLKGAMPNVQRLKLGFNAENMKRYRLVDAGFENLTSLKQISAKIRYAGADEAAGAESALADYSMHRKTPSIIVQWVVDTSRQADSRISNLSESSSQPLNPQVAEEEKVGSKQASEVEDAMVSASKGAMNSVLKKHATLMGEEYVKLRGTREEVMILKYELGAMNALLEKLADMAELTIPMKDWRNQMREVTYDIEDCIDDLMLQFEKDNTNPDYIHQATAYPEKWYALQKYILQVQSLIPVGQADPGSMVRKSTEVQILGSSFMATESRPPAVYDRAVGLVGMDGPRNELVGRMMDGNKQYTVVCILGPGGLGKTTLAKEVYNNIEGRFDFRLFVPVPQKINVTTLLRNILSQLMHREEPYGKLSYYRRDMENLIYEIRGCLQDKRYLMVFDDIWSAQTWENIQRALPGDNPASRIIITTNIRDVAESCVSDSSGFIYHMRSLRPDDSYRLFLKIIFGPGTSCPIELRKVADKILKACDGVPLSIIIMAGLLASKPAEVVQWDMVEKSMHPATEGVEKIVSIGYSDLPRQMKSCLLYMSVFPGNYVIRKDRLIRRWIAEGLIPRRGDESLWETGESYFHQLMSRKLIEPANDEWDEKPMGCKVHGLLLDFVTSLSSEENFVTKDAKATYMKHDFAIRRLTVSYSGQEGYYAFTTSTVDLSKLRSLTILGGVESMYARFRFRMPFVLALRFLRVLDLEDADNLEDHDLVPIGRLVLLRYLGLGGTGIDCLPEEIGELEHLETLDLRRTGVRTLPASIVRLRKLVSLLGGGVVLPTGLADMLQDLEELSTIEVDGARSLSWVAEMLNKSKRLRMLGVRWDHDGDYYGGSTTAANYRESVVSFLEEVAKSNLRSLHLDDYPARDGLLNSLLDSWKVPQRHLPRFELTISGGILKGVPHKMAALVNLTHLRIIIHQVETKGLRVLGDLPNLVLLKLESSYAAPGRSTISSSVGFRCLEVFLYKCEFDEMGLQFEAGAMPRLRRLRIEFSAWETICAYGDLDFGIQHLSCLERLHVAIKCRDARVSEVEGAEAAIREQVSTNPNSPVLELTRESQGSMIND